MNQDLQSVTDVAVVESQPAVSDENPSQYALRCAMDKFRVAPDWVTFFREVMGVEGIVRKTFPRSEDLLQFERSAEYAQIQQMLAKLRERKAEVPEETEPTRVITVRLPKSLHEALKSEAFSRQTSMNKLCISKLLQIIDNELVPAD